jgi:hypothetical protein
MRAIHAVVLGAGVACSVLAIQCGGGSQGGPSGSDSGTAEGGGLHDGSINDAPSGDGSMPDTSTGDVSTVDGTLNEASTGDGGSGDGSADASVIDGAVDDASDSGLDADAMPSGTQCSVDGGDAGCSAALACCNGYCVDTTRDPLNCGTCGNSCNTDQFCTGVSCDDAIFSNLCANRAATVVMDGLGPDDMAASGIGGALSSADGGCQAPLSVQFAVPDAGTVLAPDSGQPITGPGDSLVVAGGSYGQVAIGYMDSAGLSTIVQESDGTYGWLQDTGNGRNIVCTTTGDAGGLVNAQHDYFLLQLTVVPGSGTLTFSAFGLFGPGTLAAGYFFDNTVFPNLASYGERWYVVEWIDTDGNFMPSAGDTFTVLAYGTALDGEIAGGTELDGGISGGEALADGGCP